MSQRCLPDRSGVGVSTWLEGFEQWLAARAGIAVEDGQAAPCAHVDAAAPSRSSAREPDHGLAHSDVFDGGRASQRLPTSANSALGIGFGRSGPARRVP